MKRTTVLTGPGGLTPAQLIEKHRAIFGGTRMEADGESADAQQGETPSTDTSDDLAQLMDTLNDLGLTPGQIKGRLEASRLWERRAKSSDTVSREDYQRVRDELEALREGTTLEIPDEVAQQLRDEGKQQQKDADFADTAASMMRLALRAHGVKDQELIDEVISETNFGAFRGDDGRLNDEKLAKSAQRHASAMGAGQWPDMGQDKESGGRRTGVDAGREAYRSRHRKNN